MPGDLRPGGCTGAVLGHEAAGELSGDWIDLQGQSQVCQCRAWQGQGVVMRRAKASSAAGMEEAAEGLPAMSQPDTAGEGPGGGKAEREQPVILMLWGYA